MEGAQPNVVSPQKGKNPNKPKKRKLQQVYSDGIVCVVPENTLKNKKKVLESSLGSDRDWMSPPKGDTVVVLALSANSSEGKKVQRGNSSTKTSKKKNVDSNVKLEIADKHKEVCVDPQDCYPLSQMLHEPKRKKRSDRGKRSVGEKVDGREVLQDKNTEAVPSEIKKKRRSSRENKLTSENGNNNALVNNCSSNPSSGKIYTPSIATEVGHKVDNDSTLQKQDKPIKKKRRSGHGKKLASESGVSDLPNVLVNNHSEAATKTTDKHEDVHVVQSETKKKRHSGQGNKLGLESEEVFANNSSDQNLSKEKSNLPEVEISTTMPAAKISHKADAETCELQNQEAPVNKSSDAASRTADEYEEVHMVQSEIKKKRRSGQGKKLVLASAANKSPNTLVINRSDQSLIKEKSNLVGGKISAAQAAAEDSHTIDCNTKEIQNQDASINKSLVAACSTADKHEEVNMVQSDIKKRRRSGLEKKLLLESEAPKDLVNSSDQNLNEEKSNLSSGNISTKLIAAKVSHKGDAETSELQNQGAPVNRRPEVASRPADEHGEVHMVQSENKERRRSAQGKKSVLASGANKLPAALVNNHLDESLIEEKSSQLNGKISTAQLAAEVSHRIDCNTCELQNREVGVRKGLDAESQISNTQEEVCQTRQKRKRKEKNHIKEKMEPTSHQAAATLDVSSERPDPSFGQGNMTSSSDKCSLKDMAFSIGDVMNDYKVTGSMMKEKKHNCQERSDSPERANVSHSPTMMKEKKHKKRKTKSISDQAKASDSLSSLDLSTELADSSSGKEIVAASLIRSSTKEVASLTGDVRSDDVVVQNQMLDDNLLKRSASPERAHISQSLKKLLILDLNGLLVDIVSVVPKGCVADKRVSQKALLKRPFCDDFLNFCFETFNVAVWSSRTKKNVDTVVDFIMGDKRHKLLFCWDQYHCTKTGFPTVENDDKLIVLKELRKVWNKGRPDVPWERGEYNESNTLLLDDSPYKALLNPQHTAIFPDSYNCRNRKDDALGPGGSLRMYLERLAAAENVQKYIEQNPFGQRAVTCRNPSWRYYMNVMKANRFRMPL